MINKNEYELNDAHLLKNEKEEIIISLIAKFNELNGMENFVIYRSFSLFNNNDNKNNINESNKNNHSNYKYNSSLYIFIKIILILFIVIFITIIMLFCYKEIRRYQINKTINNIMINNNEKSKSDYEYFIEKKIANKTNEQKFNSKISYMIENF